METLRRTRLLLAAAAISAGLVLAACGDSGDDAPAGENDGQAQTAGERRAESRSGDGAGADADRQDRGRSGSGQGGDRGQDGGDQGAAGGGSVSLSGDRKQAREASETARGVYRDFGAAVEDGVSAPDVDLTETLDAAQGNDRLTQICDLMSEEARKQTVIYARRSAGLADVKWSCEKATGLLLRRADQSGGLERMLKAEVVAVNAKGDRATATVRFGRKGPLSTIALVREDGEWKLAATPAGGGG